MITIIFLSRGISSKKFSYPRYFYVYKENKDNEKPWEAEPR
jgi:hypothetical protein